MKKAGSFLILIIIVLVIAFGIFGSACTEIVRGNGNVLTEDRSVSDFNRLRVGGSFEVFLEQGGSNSLRIEADENLMNHIKTEVKGDVLHIYMEKNVVRAESLKAYITFIELNDIRMSGAVKLTSAGSLRFDDLDLEASGATEINLDMVANYFELDLSGSSEVYLEGNASEMNLDISGAGELYAEDFELKDCDIEVSGAGSAVVSVSDNLDINISGAASVRYKGHPRITQHVSGAGKVRSID